MKNKVAKAFQAVKDFFSKLFTWKNINTIIFAFGVICFLWVVISILYLVIFTGWAIFGATSFSGDDSWSLTARSLFYSSWMEKIMILALILNSARQIVKFFKEEDSASVLDNKIFDFFEKD